MHLAEPGCRPDQLFLLVRRRDRIAGAVMVGSDGDLGRAVPVAGHCDVSEDGGAATGLIGNVAHHTGGGDGVQVASAKRIEQEVRHRPLDAAVHTVQHGGEFVHQANLDHEPHLARLRLTLEPVEVVCCRDGVRRPTVDNLSTHRTLARFVVVAVGLMIVGLFGYSGFVAFVGQEQPMAAGMTALAAGTGFAAFFSPCSFPLLLTFLARRASDRDAVASALRVALGAALLLVVLATTILLGGSAIASVVRFESGPGRAFRVAIGTGLVAFGLVQAGGFTLPWLDRLAGLSTRVLEPHGAEHGRDVIYGFGYLLAGFG